MTTLHRFFAPKKWSASFEYLNVIKLNYGELSKIYILVYLILNYGIYENLYIFDENKTIDDDAHEKNKEANFLIIPENKKYNCSL
jgi:hypothetical protein